MGRGNSPRWYKEIAALNQAQKLSQNRYRLSPNGKVSADERRCEMTLSGAYVEFRDGFSDKFDYHQKHDDDHQHGGHFVENAEELLALLVFAACKSLAVGGEHAVERCHGEH